jgi:hypothetical protein
MLLTLVALQGYNDNTTKLILPGGGILNVLCNQISEFLPDKLLSRINSFFSVQQTFPQPNLIRQQSDVFLLLFKRLSVLNTNNSFRGVRNMHSKLLTLTFVAILGLLIAIPAHAQRETGAIVGTITDRDGAPVPGVTVIAINPARGNTTAFTGEDGYYRFPVLAPGTYDISAELEGFQTAIRKDIRLFVGATMTVDLSISPAVEEAMVISGETPMTDATTTASSKTVPVETIENLPKTSFALDLFTLTPGVGDLSYVAYGAGGAQANAYWFDGVDISNPVDGSYWIYPNYNWIEEVQVVGIGAPAEYGGFSGVITNSVSRSGSNEFHGLIETFFQNDSFQGENVGDEFAALGSDTTDLFTDSTIQLSGRLVRDKLWFFSSIQYYYSRTAPFGFPPDGSEAFVRETQPRILNKLTYKMNDNNTIQGFIQWDRYELDGGSADAFTLPEATSLNEGPEWFYNAAWVSLLSPEAVLDVRYSGYNSVYDTTGRNGDIPGRNDANTDISFANYFGFRFRDRERNQVNGSVSYHARDFIKGNHDFKFGIEYEHSNADTIDGYNGGVYYYDYLGGNYYDPTSPNWYRTLWEGYDSFSRVRRTSLFLQDDWHVTDRLNLSLGVRFDRNHSFLEEANEIEYNTNPVAPRVGVVYDVKGNQDTVIKAHYGHYYDKAITFFIDGLDNFGDRTTQYWYGPGSGWVTTDFTPGDTFFIVDPDFKQTYVEQFTIGIDKALPKNATISAHYIYRDFHNIAEDVETNGIYEEIPFINPVTGQPMTLFNRLNPDVPDSFFVTNPDGLFRNYHAIEVYGGKRFGPKFSLNGSVVWSRTRGNADNSSGGADGFTTLFDDPNFDIFNEGRPTHDPTWEVKVTGFYHFPWDVLGSFYFRHFTGDRYTIFFQTDRDTLDQGRVIIRGGPRGSERLDSRNVLDLRLEKAFPISAGSLKFTFDFFNLLNSGYVLNLNERFDQATFLEPESFTSPRQVRMGIRYQF